MTEPLRVAHIITQLELGGAQQNTLYTVTHLDPKRYLPVLISGAGGLLDSEALQSGVALHFVPSLVRAVNPAKDFAATVRLYRLLRQLKPHIVHTHSSKAGILGRVAAYLAGVPVIIHTVHGFGFTPAQSAVSRRLFILLEKWAAGLSTQLIFVSSDNREEARSLGIGQKVPSILIRSGIQRQNCKGAPIELRQELELANDATVVLAVGNFKPQKNPLDLAKVAAVALAAQPNLHFVFVGDGELRSDVERLVQQEGIESQVHFLGWRRDVARLFSAADIYLLTSLWEGLPRTLLEAFAASVPSVAYGVNGVKDVLIDGDSGFLIPPGASALAAQKVVWLASHPAEARAMGERAHAKLVKEFDIDEMVQQQQSLYESSWAAVPLKELYLPHWTLP